MKKWASVARQGGICRHVLRPGGVDVSDAGTASNLLEGNIIGPDVTGKADLGNAGAGVLIQCAASGNTLGGSATGTLNLISATGVQIEDSGTVAKVKQ